MKPLLALLLAACSHWAVAGPDYQNVPPGLQKALHGNGIKSAQMGQGVLRLQVNKPEVSELVYATFVFHSICGDQWRHPAQFADYGLKRVEMLNADASQGFAFDARGDVCVQMGQLGKNYRSFIGQYSAVCTSAGCPPLR